LAEGIVNVLSWRENMVLRYGSDLTPRGSLFLPGQGWGLTYDGKRIWRSDGSSRLYAHDPEDFSPVGDPVEVSDAGVGPGPLNELEYDPATGLVFANVYQTDLVAAIDPETGSVMFWLDLSPIARPIRAEIQNPDAVLNGLAIDANGRLFATGKMWNRLFELRFALPDGMSSRPPPESPPEAAPAFPDSVRQGCLLPEKP
jgi:glutaminyl-peptide cyclotransferase